ncbi:MAG TPA: IclR family transcriptional regulator [Ktedonobacteraceae bacterium]|jgi:IclR family KDG regulon transcriptional repressor|nr:IclR family transcriptional regulator [Ktedonobacteraceae bacterium]
MRHGEPLDGEKTVQIVHRIASVLRAFGSQGLLGITDLAGATGLPKSTTHRLVTALVNEGLLVQDEDSHKYALSLRVTALGASILSSHTVRRSARPILMELRDATHESVHLAVLEGMEAVIIDTEDSYFVVRAVNVPGQHLPAHAVSTGKVLLAYQWEVRLREILNHTPLAKYTDRTITDPRLLLEELRSVRSLGYSISCGELEEGIDAVAAPIFDHLGSVVAAVSIGGPSERCRPKQSEHIAAVTRAGHQISQALRYISWH